MQQIQPNQSERGTNGRSEIWSVERFGSLVVVNVNGEADDMQFQDEVIAASEFTYYVDMLRSDYGSVQ